MANQILNTGIYLSLLAQLDKLARHNRQGASAPRSGITKP